jgi:pimeloyl-ACP methyl ester carboxylesterase
MPFLLALPLVLAAVYIAVSAYAAERISRPVRYPLTDPPGNYGLDFEDATFTSSVDKIPLRGWYIGVPGDRAIVMAHGRNGIRDGGGATEIASLLVKHGCSVLMFDFRAHGTSGGKRYGMGVWETRDIEGALDFLRRRGAKRIGVYATSMGASTALLAAPDHPEIVAILADSPFANLPDLLQEQLPQATGLPGYFSPGILLLGRVLYGLDFSNDRPEKAVALLRDRPVLHIHSRVDEVIPVGHAYRIRKAGASNPNFTSWIAPVKGHCRAYAECKQEYTERMLDFFGRYLA